METSIQDTNQSLETSKKRKDGKQITSSSAENSPSPASWGEIIPFLYSTLVGLACMYSYYNYRNMFFIVWVIYSLIPWIDYITPIDHSNLPENRVRIYEKDKRFLIPLYSFWILDFILFYWILYDVYSGKIGTRNSSFLIMALCIAQIGAINAVVGHELFHKKPFVHKLFGTLVYVKMIYGHFFIQHVRSHHKHVATPQDPSTARLGESLFYFFWRAIPEGYKEVWDYEQARLKQQGCEKWWQILLFNRCITINAGQIVYLSLILGLMGTRTLVFHLLVSFIITLMLEAINFIEHYGLQRKFIAGSDSVYESVNITHSWNAPQVVTNWFIFKLQRHSDHHANAYKPYQILDSFVESPMLPYGYTVSLLVVIFPSIWRKIIDPLAIATNKGEKITKEEQSNIEKWILIVLICTTTVFTYLTFIGIGLTPMI